MGFVAVDVHNHAYSACVMFVRGVVQSACLVDVHLCVFNTVIFVNRILFLLFNNLYAMIFYYIASFCFA